MNTRLARLCLCALLPLLGCAPADVAPREPFALAGATVTLETRGAGRVSPSVRAGRLLWGEGSLSSHRRVLLAENFPARAELLRDALAAELSRRGADVLPGEGGEAVVRLDAEIQLGESETLVPGYDRKGRKVSLTSLKRCAMAAGTGSVDLRGERVLFDPEALWCDTLLAETRADAFARASWGELVDRAAERMARVWARRIHAALLGRPSGPGDDPFDDAPAARPEEP